VRLIDPPRGRGDGRLRLQRGPRDPERLAPVRNPGAGRRDFPLTAALVAPAVLFLLAFFVLPLLQLLRLSFASPEGKALTALGLTDEPLALLFNRRGDRHPAPGHQAGKSVRSPGGTRRRSWPREAVRQRDPRGRALLGWKGGRELAASATFGLRLRRVRVGVTLICSYNM